jgi:hypothetical protein
MEKWIAQIDAITSDFRSAFDHLSVEQLNWKPTPQKWSIAQNIDHVIVINASYFPIFEDLRKETLELPKLAKWDFIVSYFGKFILKSSQPDRRKRMKTYALWEPTIGELSSDILAQFEEHQNKLKTYIAGSDDLIEFESVIPSPVNKNIVYKLETAFDIIVAHERRHFMQAKEVLELAKNWSPLRTPDVSL